MPNDSETLKSRISGRKKAEECLEFVEGESDELDEAGREAFLKVFKDKFQPPKQEEGNIEHLMSPGEVKRFEKKKMPFGQYGPQGTNYSIGWIVENDLDYLLWLLDEDTRFVTELRRYLKQPEIAKLLQPADNEE